MLKEIKMPLNLQFFAEPDNSGEENESPKDNAELDVEKKEENVGENKPPEKTFTQKQVNAMMAKEKREGKNSILSSLGFKTEEEAKKAVALYNSLMDSQKSEDEKKDEKNESLQNEKDEMKKRAEMAEAKLQCLGCGVDKDSIEDVLVIALNKVSDEKDLEVVLSEMKKDKKYSSFFISNNSGTGKPPVNNNTEGSVTKGIGKRLAESTKKSNKSSYF